MTTYRIKTTAWTIWLPTFLLTMLGGVLLGIKFLPNGDFISIVSTIFLLLLAFFLQRFTSTALVEVKLTKKDISICWLSQYIFHKYPDRTILLSDIESYKYEPDRNFDLLKLTMKDGSEIKLWHFALTFGDDFDKLIIDFPQLVNGYNKSVKSKVNFPSEISQTDYEPREIKREKTMYEGSGAVVIAAFAVVLIIAVPLILYFDPGERQKNPFILLASMTGAIFFFTQFYRYRKNSKAKT